MLNLSSNLPQIRRINLKRQKMITAKALYASARLRSLPLSVSGVLLGSGAAYGAGVFRADIFALALLTTLLFQVLSDYANDYGDAVKGTDDDGRLGRCFLRFAASR